MNTLLVLSAVSITFLKQFANGDINVKGKFFTIKLAAS